MSAAPRAASEPADKLARRHRQTRGSRRHAARVRRRIRRLQSRLRTLFGRLERRSRDESELPAAAQELLDNLHVVEEALLQIGEDLPRGFLQSLPCVELAPVTVHRVYDVAAAALVAGGSEVDVHHLHRFLHDYQQVTPLAMGELWALPSMLRLQLLERIDEAAATLLEAHDGDSPRQPRIGRHIRGLRRLAVTDWHEFFEATSAVEKLLRRDPAAVYSRMDFESRDRYRKAVEELARGIGAQEEAVARMALASSRKAAPDTRERHIGYFLVDAGVPQLAAALVSGSPRDPSFQVRTRLAGKIRRHGTAVLLGGIGTLTGILLLMALGYGVLAGATAGQLLVLAVVAAVPAVTLASTVVSWALTMVLPPQRLPRMRLPRGIPRRHRTLVVFPCLLTSAEEVESLLHGLEVNLLANQDRNLHFALLSDWADAREETVPGDEGLLEAAVRGIEALNRRHPGRTRRPERGPFHLLHRRRLWNPRERRWMGWERKRGKLEELNRLLLGDGETTFETQVGDAEFRQGVRHVITLDADTLLPRGAARELVGAMAHPLNEAAFDADGRVAAGYTVLQPRVEITPWSANRSLFARIFSGSVGLDLYTRAVSDLYQDLHGEGIYAGKGLYSVASFHRSLAGKVPENALLSHDLFEGVQGRAGLISDVVVFEDHPSHVLGYLDRLHRWVRGDWQLLPWLLPRVPLADGSRAPNRLDGLARWKLFDNLRRSLVAPSLLAFLIAGWVLLPGHTWLWTAVAIGTLAVTLPLETFSVSRRLLRGEPWRTALSQGSASMGVAMSRLAIELALLPAQSALVVDAVGRTLYRLAVSRRRLLEWTAAARAARRLGARPRPWIAWRRMIAAPVLATAIAGAVVAATGGLRGIAVPFLLLWLVSPQLAHAVSLPRRRRRAPLAAGELRKLHLLARRTWHFFERYVSPVDHWLPPDNFQEEPGGQVARRTSPTNIGFYLLSLQVAFDLGYVGIESFAVRLHGTLTTLERMSRHRGHFWNWYSTESLVPLEPRYVSTVDSGNLAACLIAVSEGIETARSRTPLPRRRALTGLADIVGLLAGTVAQLPRSASGPREDVARDLAALENRLRGHTGDPRERLELLERIGSRTLPRLEALIVEYAEDLAVGEAHAALLGELRAWLELLAQSAGEFLETTEALTPWLHFLHDPPAVDGGAPREVLDGLRRLFRQAPELGRIPDRCRDALALLARLHDCIEGSDLSAVERHQVGEWSARFQSSLQAAAHRAASLHAELGQAATSARAMAEAMDFRFLFDRARKLFHLGYNASSGQLDANHYDLLASEARLASFIAIAKGDAPLEHWLHLGRPFGRVAGDRALLSWGGTAFEHLLPNLLLETPDGSTLAISSRAIVRRQMRFGRRLRLPWGISESGFASLGSGGWYQYRAFGVPGTGLKRGLGDRLVITPYASLLALPIEPRAVIDNLEKLAALGMAGRYGLYEAADFGLASARRRQPDLVRSYMSHHQGMILTALGELLGETSAAARFHADAQVASVEILVHEEVRFAPLTHTWVSGEHLPGGRRAPLPTWSPRGPADRPQLQILGNGRLRLLLADSGAGGSSWRDATLTTWQPDTSHEAQGTWIYLQDTDSGAVWSAGETAERGSAFPGSYRVQFAPHQVEIHRSDHGIVTHLTTCVAAHEDLEVRHLRLVNESGEPRRLLVTSAAAPLLAPVGEAERHPAFARLFVEIEAVPELGALVARRRPRSVEEPPIFMAQAMVPEPAEEWEGDRAAFLGRGGGGRNPQGLARPLSGTAGATLDPVLALRRTVELGRGEEIELALLTAVGASRQSVVDALDRYGSPARLALLFEEAEALARDDLRAALLAAAEAPLAQELLSALYVPATPLRASPAILAADHAGRAGLWGHGLSGDLPILLVRSGRDPELRLLRSLLRIHAFWRRRGEAVDLIVLDEEGEGYAWPLREQLDRDLARTGALEWLHRSGGVFLVRAKQLPAQDRSLLLAAASVVLSTDGRGLDEQLATLHRRPARLPELVPMATGVLAPEETPALKRPADLVLDNGYGGFTRDGREYLIHLEPGEATPAPWINVVANPSFGFLVSESGSSTTWALDSSENRITPWPNDPAADPSGEALYLRDEETGEIWSPSRQPAGAETACQARHGAGYTVLERASHGLEQSLTLFVPRVDPVKIGRLRLTNLRQRPRRITATWYAEWVLGGRRSRTARHLVPELVTAAGALLCRNPFHERYPHRTAFLAADRVPHGFTTDRTEFLGRDGDLSRPEALRRIGLASSVRAGGDLCAALQIHLDIPPGATVEAHFLLGQGEDRAAALELIGRYREPQAVEAAWREIGTFWDRLLESVVVRTPEPEIDLLANRWLLYQTLACRLWGRAGLYQSSGAYGFRDQLQDVTALLAAAPELARAHILEAARRQFAAGDVLHWWHPGTTRGLRSRCSDDLVWLPWATTQYVAATGDRTILDEVVPYLGGPELPDDQAELYDDFAPSSELGTLHEHCLRALEKASTHGRHGLPLIGSSDWNDGMDRVGREGEGESVWLAFFLYAVLHAYAPLCAEASDDHHAARLTSRADAYREAVEASGWDGAWYTRAFYDDGSALGAKGDDEAEIDLVAQAWAVLSAAADPERASVAMESALERLGNPGNRVIGLLAPPFDLTPRDPGYIKAYPPGVRENGGQYNHAAIWAAWALTRLGRGDDAMALQRWINPAYRTATAAAAARYRLEPYAVAGDICAPPTHPGRGGWSWYTGSAGWLHRLILEGILGLRRRAGRLELDPCLPEDWPGFHATLRVGASRYEIHVRNEPGAAGQRPEIRLDGRTLPDTELPLDDDGKEHLVEVTSRASQDRPSAAASGTSELR